VVERTDYEALIRTVTEDGASDVYVDDGDRRLGGAIWLVGVAVDSGVWLVKVHADGAVRTAFPCVDPDNYLYDRTSRYIGAVRTVLAWTQG
jgi:hypothetical protein